ncbi:acyltransferase family protein [Pseudorhodobacter ferrugineus]|uniref:acyltransferase family protein n=1 Tax=Pseudorhodobacter ferrugineus TaxID=77008 RepID=UPI0003B312CF|nr:acyltransferase [Pseudorhodobacter ferrugineus]
MSQRLTGFDVVKAVAIIFVIIGHTWRGLNTAGMIPDAALFARIDAAIYLFHMPVFFFLSGLFFSARRPWPDFLQNRAILLLWPMLLWGWIDAGLKSAAGIPIKGHVYSAAEVVLSVLPPVGIFWFLYTLFILHVIAWALARLPRPAQLLVMAALAVAARAGWINVSPFDSLWNTVIYLPPFFAGIAFAMLAGHGALLRKGLILPGILAFGAAQALVAAGATAGGPWLGTLATALATAGFVMVWANLPLFANLTAWLARLGQYTMPIYLTHVIFSAATRVVLRALGVSDLAPHMLLGTVAGLLGPLVLIWLAKRAGLSVWVGFEAPRRA